jgi:hypothetical protein
VTGIINNQNLSSGLGNGKLQNMTAETARPTRRFNWSTVRWLIYFTILLGVVVWKYCPRPWTAARTIETPHYLIASTASQAQTEEVGRVVELLYNAYSNRFGTLPTFRHEHPKLMLLFYKDRREFRWVNPDLGWAEAFYRKPYCRAYYSADEINHYHWMLHEAVHQLNREVAQLDLVKWLDEGTAEYFSTSRIQDGQLMPGRIDPNTYPVWWMDEIATAPDLQASLTNGSVIPLRAIITDRGGPGMNQEFNLYYLHWWTLTHFIFENPKYRTSAMILLQRGGELEAFEQTIGPVANVEPDWYCHVRRIKAALAGKDRNFHKTGQLPPDP